MKSLLCLLALLGGCAVDTAEPLDVDGNVVEEGKYDGALSRTSLTLEGTNVLAPEGAQVSAWFFHGFGEKSPTLTVPVEADQTFTMRWPDSWERHSYGAFVHVWVDVDADGACSAVDTKLQAFVANTFDGDVEASIDIWRESQRWPTWCDDFADVHYAAEDPVDCDALCNGPRWSRGCFGVETCTTFCGSRLPRASQATHDAFEMCALTNPLCYERADDCVEAAIECLDECAETGADRDACLGECRFGKIPCIERCEAAGGERGACLEACGEF